MSAGASSSSSSTSSPTPKFAVGETFVCLRDDLPCSAKIAAIENGHYLIHYENATRRHDERVPIGKERGKMLKGSVDEFERKDSSKTTTATTPRESMDKENGGGGTSAARRRTMEVKKEDQPSTSGTPRRIPAPIFALHEMLVCLHHKVPYAAKINAVKEDYYVVHYCGYKDSQNEKVRFGNEKGKMFAMNLEEYGQKYKVPIPKESLDKERLVMAKQKKAAAAAAVVQEDSGEGTSALAPSSSEVQEPVTKKRKLTIQDAVNPSFQLEGPIQLTDSLVKVLVKDYVMVKNNGMLPVIPAGYTVKMIFQEYSNHLQEIREENRLENTAEDQYFLTLKGYFNDGFNTAILLANEREQHIERVKQVLKSKKIRFRNLENVDRKHYKATKDYGIAHLLRLIYRFHDLMNGLPYPSKSHVERIKASLEDFVEFLDDNWERFYDQNAYHKA